MPSGSARWRWWSGPSRAPRAPGEVLVRPEAVGICGSDYHFFSGELSDAAGGSQFPRVLGHEVGATITAVGPDCRPDLMSGQRVAMLPLSACGRCYPCSVGRPNACDNFQLIGIHTDGGLQDLLSCRQEQVFPIQAPDGALAAMAEPVSIAVRAVHRGRIAAGERVVVLGAGPIGQCVGLVARERGADVLLIDLQESRLALSRAIGRRDAAMDRRRTTSWLGAREWARPGGPPVAVDATGVPAAVRAMVDMVASAGRAVQVGMSSRRGAAADRQPDREGARSARRQLLRRGDFAEAVGVVERNADALARLISHEFALAAGAGGDPLCDEQSDRGDEGGDPGG